MTPIEASAAVRGALASVPNTRALTVVSSPKPGVAISALDSLLGYAKVAKESVLDIFAPNDFNVPGAAPIARAVAKGASKVADAGASTIKSLGTSATEGVKSGFKMATLILVLIVGVWVWSVIKPPRG